MNTRNLLIALVSCLALAAAPLVGCGADDPSQNQNTGNGDGDNSDQTDPDAGETEPDADETEPDADETEPDADAGEEEEEFVLPECEANPMFYGQLGDNDKDFSGGEPTTDAFETSSGLQAVFDHVDALIADEGELPEGDDGFPADIVLETPIEIDGATITSTWFGGNFDSHRSRFWLGDADTAIHFRLPIPTEGEDSTDANILPVETHVGQQVKFNVTHISFFRGNAQISGYSDWEVLSDDASNPVSFTEKGTDVLGEEDIYRIVRMGGAVSDNSWECGGNYICYEMFYGADNEHSITFRSNSSFIEVGDCMTYMGPVGANFGPYADSIELQIDAINYDWHFTDFDF